MRDLAQDNWNGLEGLEGRLMLDGAVAGSVSGGYLNLKGDLWGNQIALDQAGLLPGQVRVSGVNGTLVRVKGVFYAEYIFQNVTRGAKIRLSGGDDAADLNSLNLAGNLLVDGGKGDNTIRVTGGNFLKAVTLKNSTGSSYVDINGAGVAGQTKIYNGDGNQSVILTGTFDQPLYIKNGYGSHSVTLDGADFESVRIDNRPGDSTTVINNTTFLRNLGVYNRWGADSLAITATTVAGRVTIDNGQGASDTSITGSDINTGFDWRRPRSLYLVSDGGYDSVAVDNTTFGGDVWLDTGWDGSDIALGNSSFAGQLWIDTYSGQDNISLTNIGVDGRLDIYTGEGADQVSIDDSDFGGFAGIQTGWGNDQIYIETAGAADGPRTTFAGSVDFYMGGDDDDLVIGVAGQSGNLAAFNGYSTVFDGGWGDNALSDSTDNQYAHDPYIFSFHLV
jgi:hypothetical protein